MSNHGEIGIPEGAAGCGRRLRDAREAAGLSIAEVGARLKMPARVVESLEREDWSRLGAPVFVRGQLRSYSRLLGLVTEPIMVASGVAPVATADLRPRTYTPPMQRLAEQASRRFVYVVLTAAIAVPVWLMTTRPNLTEIAAQTASLDVSAPSPSARADAQPARPMVASLAPMPASQPATDTLTLALSAQSWVQVTGTDGRVLESGMLEAGQHDWPASRVARMVIGNASAAQLRRNGELQDLAALQRANVARFTVSSDGRLQPAVD